MEAGGPDARMNVKGGPCREEPGSIESRVTCCAVVEHVCMLAAKVFCEWLSLEQQIMHHFFEFIDFRNSITPI